MLRFTKVHEHEGLALSRALPLGIQKRESFVAGRVLGLLLPCSLLSLRVDFNSPQISQGLSQLWLCA